MKPIHYLVAFTTLNHGTLAAARVAVALYAVSLDASPTMVAILVALFSVIPTLACVPMGRLVDRTGARWPMLVCTLLCSAGAVLPFFWEEIAALVVTGTVVGGAYFAQMHLGIAAANGVGPLIAGFGIDHLGHDYTFLLIALLPLASLAIMLAGRLPHLDDIVAAGKDAESGSSFVDLLRDRRMLPIYLTTVMFMPAWDIFMVMTPLYGKELGLSASQIGIIISTYSAAVFVVRMFLGPLTRRYTTWQLLLISLSIAAGCMVGCGLSGAVPLLILFACGMGFGQGMGGPLGNTTMYETAPAHRVSEAPGLRMSVTTACQTGLPLIAGGAELAGRCRAAVLAGGRDHLRGRVALALALARRPWRSRSREMTGRVCPA